MRKPKEYELILWEDPSSDYDGWKKIEDLGVSHPELAFSIGWPVYEDEHIVRLAMDWCDGECNTRGKIPKTAIKARKKLNLRGFPPKEKKANDQNSREPV